MMKKIINLIDDIPSLKDRIGNLEPITETIYELVKTNVGGKAIALLGKWGSGKSTVIELLRNLISEKGDNSISVFLYDSWAHRGEPLRKSFILDLVKHLVDNKWLETKNNDFSKSLSKNELVNIIKNEEIQNKLKTLIGSKKKIERESRPNLNILGKIGIIIFILYTILIANAWRIIAYLSNIYEFYISENIYFQTAMWIILTFLIPSIIFLIIYLIIRLTKKDSAELFGLFLNKTAKEEITEEFAERDPLFIDFKSFYEAIMDKALINDRRLIIVLDNLDRVEPAMAKEMLANIKPFIQEIDRENEIFEKIWYLVAFDEDSFNQLWAKKSDNEEKDSYTENLSNEFIKKIFQLKFYIPYYTDVRWYDYLFEKIREVFNEEISEELLYFVLRNFNLLRDKTEIKEIPTPRQIIDLVNNLAITYLLVETINKSEDFEFEASFKSATIYVLLKRYINEEIDETINYLSRVSLGYEEYPKFSSSDSKIKKEFTEFLFELDEEIKKLIIGIHFGVPKEDSIEVSLLSVVNKTIVSIVDKSIREDDWRLARYIVRDERRRYLFFERLLIDSLIEQVNKKLSLFSLLDIIFNIIENMGDEYNYIESKINEFIKTIIDEIINKAKDSKKRYQEYIQLLEYVPPANWSDEERRCLDSKKEILRLLFGSGQSGAGR
jgi:hypothetical protein